MEKGKKDKKKKGKDFKKGRILEETEEEGNVSRPVSVDPTSQDFFFLTRCGTEVNDKKRTGLEERHTKSDSEDLCFLDDGSAQGEPQGFLDFFSASEVVRNPSSPVSPPPDGEIDVIHVDTGLCEGEAKGFLDEIPSDIFGFRGQFSLRFLKSYFIRVRVFFKTKKRRTSCLRTK